MKISGVISAVQKQNSKKITFLVAILKFCFLNLLYDWSKHKQICSCVWFLLWHSTMQKVNLLSYIRSGTVYWRMIWKKKNKKTLRCVYEFARDIIWKILTKFGGFTFYHIWNHRHLIPWDIFTNYFHFTAKLSSQDWRFTNKIWRRKNI